MKNTVLKMFSFFCFALLLNGCLPVDGIQAPSGRYVGLNDTTFLGIPYALPPVGNLRWRAPVTKPSMGTRTAYLASFKRPGCLQGAGFTGVFLTAEDCLYLNLWRPTNRTGALPVMFFIHGGASTIGSGSEVQYDGKALAEKYGVIVVTINSRLGVFGFLALDDFMSEGLADDGVAHAGNYGHLDQLKALEWVHNNISAFGGNPNNVTLFGESAGAISTCYHIASPLSTAKNYFHRAIIQSGHCEFATRTQALANSQGTTYSINAFGCSPTSSVGDGTMASCLRAKSGSSLVELEKLFCPTCTALAFDRPLPLLNAVDDNFFIKGGTTHTVTESLKTNSRTTIPVIMGTNLNEGTLLNAFTVPTVLTNTDYANFLVDFFDAPGKAGDSATVSALYPIGNYSLPINAVSDAQGDLIFPCAARRTADTLQERGHKVYVYELRQALESPFIASFVLTFNDGLGPDLGVFHSSDIPFVFGTNSVLGDATRPAAKPTMLMMQEYWTSFAKTGTPTSATAQGLGIAAWPQYVSPANGGNRSFVALQSVAPAVESQIKQTKCDYWAANQDPLFFDVH